MEEEVEMYTPYITMAQHNFDVILQQAKEGEAEALVKLIHLRFACSGLCYPGLDPENGLDTREECSTTRY